MQQSKRKRIQGRNRSLGRIRSRRKRDNRKFSRKMQAKLVQLFLLIALALFGLAVRLMYINDTKGHNYTIQVLAQQSYQSRSLPYQRGSITDRNGIVLAASEKVYNMILDAKIMNSDDGKYLNTTLTALSGCFGYEIGELSSVIAANPDSQYIVYKKGMTYDEIKYFQSLQSGKEKTRPSWFPDNYSYKNIQGVWFEEEYKRQYPYSTLACDLIGFVNSGNDGNWGIEQYYNSELNGTNGRIYGYLNSDSAMEKVIKPATDGHTIVSTIDVNLQMIAEKYVKEYYETVGAKNVAVMMMDPNNGEILAEATAPWFDLNKPRDLSAYFTEEQLEGMTSEEKSNFLYGLWKNFALSEVYEPGSTGKPFTVAAGLEEAVVYQGEVFNCKGYIKYGDADPIHCHNRWGDGDVTLEESIQYSCNVALMTTAERMGKSIFCKYQDIFNFGKRTGVDLPGEERGLLYTLDNMNITDLATNSFGQNYNVTMMQMAAAFSSLVNGGYYYEPHVMKKITDASGATIKTAQAEVVKSTISESTSKWMREVLYQTVENGTGSKARIEGYTIGGKTGTAEKHPRDEGRYLVSFISFAPVDNPQIVLYVVIDEPNIENQSDASQATIMTNKLYSEIFPYMGIFSSIDLPDKPEGEPESETSTTAEPEEGETESTETGEGETTESGEASERVTPVYNEIWPPGFGFMGPSSEETSAAETTAE